MRRRMHPHTRKRILNPGCMKFVSDMGCDRI
jgi:hypothetical protein